MRRRAGSLALVLVLFAGADRARAQDAGSTEEGATGATEGAATEGEGTEGEGTEGEGTEGEAATGEETIEVPATSATPVPTRTFIVVDAAAYGIDPIVGRVTTDVMR